MLEEIYKKAKIEKTHLLLYENKKLLIRKTLKNNKKVIVISENIGYKYNRIEWQYRLDLKSGNNNTAFIKEINSEICFNIVDYKFFLKHKNSGQMVFVSLKNPCQNVIIRNRRNGDRIKLEFGHKKIKDLLIDQKINNTIKESVPLLIINHDIAAFMPFLITDLPYRVSVDYHIISTSDKILAVYKNDIL
jgi:tRNA(Ile)-lysidine synthetase-like protein